jgi:hypothetical protein
VLHHARETRTLVSATTLINSATTGRLCVPALTRNPQDWPKIYQLALNLD